VRRTIGEASLIDESLSDYEAVAVSFDVAHERGHASPSVAVDESGRVVTQPGFVDRMAASNGAGGWLYCRHPAADSLGMVEGTEWVRAHSMHLMFEGGSPFRSEPHFYDQLYLDRPGSPAQMAFPSCSVHPPAWSNCGTRVAVLEERLGPLAAAAGAAKTLLWEHDLTEQSRRLVAGFPDSVALGLVEASYSPDDRWILLADWGLGRCHLVSCDDGVTIELPVSTPAASWNAALGPSLLTVVTPGGRPTEAVVLDIDLETGRRANRLVLRAPGDQPLSIRELSVSADGALALATASVGGSAEELAARGGVHIAAVIDFESGVIEPVLPINFKTPHAQRRHTSPRWVEPRTRSTSPTVIHADLAATGRQIDYAADPDAVRLDQVDRWLESACGILDAWSRRRLQLDFYRDEFAAFVHAAGDTDPSAADRVMAVARSFAHERQFFLECLPGIQDLAWHGPRDRSSADLSLLPPPPPTAQQAAAETHFSFSKQDGDAVRIGGTAGLALPQVKRQVLESAIVALIAAETAGQVFGAARSLVEASSTPGSPLSEGAWLAVLDLVEACTQEGNPLLGAQAALATFLYTETYLPSTPQLLDSGLHPPGEDLHVEILRSGFACTVHLAPAVTIGGDSQAVFTSEDVRARCQYQLNQLGYPERFEMSWPINQVNTN
jgi:hypothetical protein